ncbi:unnamed protein product [Adineta steineri]|uniref:Aminopeptidase n=1 Tax=Adineta steineri TaxID=433720 RepID=A0A814RDK9_9BILA|nr:unnamed protein product [Adineta steineri]
MKKLDRKLFGDVCCWFKTFISIIVFLLAVAVAVFPFFIYYLTRSIPKLSSELTHRLPTTIIPSNYRLYIDSSQLEQFVFHGTVDIDIQINKIVNEIILNSFDLNITGVKYHQNDTDLFSYGTVEYDNVYEQIRLKFSHRINIGHGRVYLSFKGRINDQLHGFYRTKNHEHIGACTQFEAAYARRAFPCFDEPSFKANFSITIRAPKHLTTLCNMPIKSKHADDNNTYTYEFDSTPIMSTYLVAYVIGHYDYVETRDSDNVLIRVYTPIGKKEQGLFALTTAAKILPFYAEYFGIKYPLSKLDMIAIADFGSGAMENWGLITYRETYLLVDTHISTQKTRQEVALVVAHELAHQWFGNLVTMEWWNDLWLNEDNFASWIEFLAVDHVYPEYDIWTQFVSDTLATCMIPDALQSSHPIEVSIRKPSEIDEIFDDITYGKGSSVIRLLHAYIGNEAFRRGLSNYLAEYAYKNTITDNLWFHLSKASNRTHLSDVLSTWTKQIGYPLLMVNQEQRGNDRLLTIEQTRFLADGTRDDSLKWKIPINICTKSNPNSSVFQLYLNGEKKQEFLLKQVPDTEWIKLNLFSVGIYRVHYPQSMLEALTPGIQNHTLSPQDRFNIQTDVYALARAGHLGYVDYLKLLRYAYKYEDNLTVWKSIIRQLTELSSIFEYAQLNNTKILYQSYVCDLLSNIYNKIGWDALPNEDSQIPMLRSLILIYMGINAYDQTRIEAHKRFENFSMQNNDYHLINPNIRAAIYLTVAKTGNQQTFDQLKSLYLKADTQEERIRLLTALCRFDDEYFQRQALIFIWNTTAVRKQDHLTGFASLAQHNRQGCEMCWTYMQNNWNKIESIYGRHDSHLVHFIETVPGLFISKERAEEVQKFYANYPNPYLERSVKKVLEQIRIRRLVLERHELSINEFLNVQ